MNAETHPFTSAYPELGTGPVPVEPYISKDYFERECAQIFARTWINVGCEEQIPNPGDYFVRELAVCNTSVIVMRGKDKRVRSFHNMCSHRGNPVAWETQGTCKGLLVCNFHGWSYDTEGKLAYVTDEERFFNVDRAKNGLTAIATDTWEGFIFINLAPEPRESLAEFLGPAAAAMDGYPFSQYSYTYVYEVDDGVNWKVLTEAQLEGWHVPVLHKKTLAKSVVNKGELFRHAALQRYGRHALVSSHAPEVYTPTPVTAVSMKYGVGTFDAFSVESENSGNRDMKWHGAFDLYHVFPNMFLGLLRGTYFTYNIWPLAVDRSMWEIRVFYPPAANAGQLFSQEFGKAGIRDTLREDAFTHEKIQSVLKSGAKRQFHLQDEELVVRHFLRVVDDYVQGNYE